MSTQPHMAAPLTIRKMLIIVMVVTWPRYALEQCISWDFGSRSLSIVLGVSYHRLAGSL